MPSKFSKCLYDRVLKCGLLIILQNLSIKPFVIETVFVRLRMCANFQIISTVGSEDGTETNDK